MSKLYQTSLLEVFRKYWGFYEFRPNQQEICETILQGKDAMVIQSTGSGKSLLYQLPSIYLNENGIRATTIVISPLLSLIEDQMTHLKQMNIPVGTIGGDYNEKNEEDARRGKFFILYLTPEKILSWESGFKELLSRTRICCVAIDEAHCVSEWGHDFRVQYRQLNRVIGWCPSSVPIIALTATATTSVVADVISNLELRRPLVYRSTCNRSNIKYSIYNRNNVNDALRILLNYYRNTTSICNNSDIKPNIPCLIYTNSKREAEEICTAIQSSQALSSAGIRAAFYHAGMTKQSRMQIHNSFQKDEINVIVCTVAFGMGISKPDIRLVINYGMPKSIEAFTQQSGRAGRDGVASESIILFNRNDIIKSFHLQSDKSEKCLKAIELQLKDVVEFCSFPRNDKIKCRREYIIKYFDDNQSNIDFSFPRVNCCDLCDIELSNSSNITLTSIDVNNVIPSETVKCNLGHEIYLLLQTLNLIGDYYGLGVTISILVGSHDKKVQRIYNYDTFVTFGQGKYRSVEWWKVFAYQLCNEGLIQTNFVKCENFSYNKYSITRTGNEFLLKYLQAPIPYWMIETLEMKNHPSICTITKSTSMAKESYIDSVDSGSNKLTKELVNELDLELRQMRSQLASDCAAPPYSILSSTDLVVLAETCPTNIDQLRTLSGWASWKVEKFGEQFLSVICSFLQKKNITLQPSASSSSHSSNLSHDKFQPIAPPASSNMNQAYEDAYLEYQQKSRELDPNSLKLYRPIYEDFPSTELASDTVEVKNEVEANIENEELIFEDIYKHQPQLKRRLSGVSSIRKFSMKHQLLI